MSNTIGLKEYIYYHCPVFLQNVLCSVKGYSIRTRRYSKGFFSCLDAFKKRSYNQEYELRKFCKSIQQVPYYIELFDKYAFNVDAENLFEEFKKLPIMTKADAVQNKERLINPSYKGKTLNSSTGGTTGAGLEFPLSYDAEHKQWAVCWRYREDLGIKFDTWHGWFGGKIIIPPTLHKSPYWRLNYPCKQVMFSSLHLSDKTISDFHKCILEKKLTWLHGYSANINLLANLIVTNNLEPIDCVRFVTTGSDNLLGRYRRTIKKAFPNAVIATHYAQSECVANISEHLDGKFYVDTDFSYVELLPFDPEHPKLRKVIGTNFVNYAFPLLRYDTGDVVTVEEDATGYTYISKIDGRESDYLTLPNGHKMGVTFLDNFEILKDVNAVQIYQPSINNLIIRIETAKKFSHETESMILNDLQARLSCDIDISFEYLEKIERTKSGKLRLLISDI